ncbi:MAG: 3-oxoacyl-[acyl-carrier protein] reductase [Verrucomicrobiales bacterium]|jgi:3-oxoacyl-[acyl-carrier protein] reductase
MGQLDDKIAVVTGGGRGIGKAIAMRFAAEGAKVAVVSRSEASCSAAADEINAAHPGSAQAFAVDVADFETTVALGKTIIEALGKVDILVNNAGVTRDNLAMRMTEEDWDTVIDTNLKGAFNCIKAFQRSLMRQKGARVINISSVVGLMGAAGQLNYSASKAGLIGMTKSLAKEYAGRGMRVNAIAPGFISTDMTSSLTDAQKDGILKAIPLRLLGESNDIAEAAAFLAGPGGNYITGQVLTVDGGMVM